MNKLRHHVFVCRNTRPDGDRPSCAGRGAHRIYAALVAAIAGNPELAAVVQVTGCECLGPCWDGPNILVYPEGVHYAEVTEADVHEIVTGHLQGGVVVERLRADDESDDGPVGGRNTGDGDDPAGA